jgi:hypothetical protein
MMNSSEVRRYLFLKLRKHVAREAFDWSCTATLGSFAWVRAQIDARFPVAWDDGLARAKPGFGAFAEGECLVDGARFLFRIGGSTGFDGISRASCVALHVPTAVDSTDHARRLARACQWHAVDCNNMNAWLAGGEN